MKALLAGPTADEKAAGLSERYPGRHATPRPDHRRRDGRVDLSADFTPGGGAFDGGPRRAGRLHAHTVPDGAFRRVPGGGRAARGAGRRGSRSAGPRVAPTGATSSRPSSSSRRASALVSSPFVLTRHGERVRGRVPGAPRRLVRAGASSTCRPGEPRRSRPRPLRQGDRLLHLGQERHADRLRPVDGGRLAPGRGEDPRHVPRRTSGGGGAGRSTTATAGKNVAGSAGVTPAYVGLESTLILPIDPPRPPIVHRRGGCDGARRRRRAARAARAPP